MKVKYTSADCDSMWLAKAPTKTAESDFHFALNLFCFCFDLMPLVGANHLEGFYKIVQAQKVA